MKAPQLFLLLIFTPRIQTPGVGARNTLRGIQIFFYLDKRQFIGINCELTTETNSSMPFLDRD